MKHVQFEAMDYLIVQISGRQYKVEENKPFAVDFLGEEKTLEAEVLARSKGGKLEVGAPFLKDKAKFEVIGTHKTKIRVAKYHAKANTRKVRGQKQLSSTIKLVA
jgi:ribosomal protein L21